jgi:hypothetical protein
MEIKPRWLVTAIITAIILVITNISALPIQYTNSFQISQYSTGQTSGYQQTWTLMNSSNLEVGSSVSGNATFEGFQYQTGSGSALPQLYVLSPSQLTTWLSVTPLGVPKVSTQVTLAIIDFQSMIISFKFRFDVKEAGAYYFVMIATNLATLPYPSKPSAALTYSATTSNPPSWVRLLGVPVPVLAWLLNKSREYRLVPVKKKK